MKSTDEFGCIWYVLVPLMLLGGSIFGYNRYRTTSIYLDNCEQQVNKTDFRGLVPLMSTKAVWALLGKHDDKIEDPEEDGYSLTYYNERGKLELPLDDDEKGIGIVIFHPKYKSQIADYILVSNQISRQKRKVHIFCSGVFKYTILLDADGYVKEFQYWDE